MCSILHPLRDILEVHLGYALRIQEDSIELEVRNQECLMTERYVKLAMLVLLTLIVGCSSKDSRDNMSVKADVYKLGRIS